MSTVNVCLFNNTLLLKFNDHSAGAIKHLILYMCMEHSDLCIANSGDRLQQGSPLRDLF